MPANLRRWNADGGDRSPGLRYRSRNIGIGRKRWLNCRHLRNIAGPAHHAAAGLSIVVPVFNEGAGLVRFHDRLVEIARQLRQQRGLALEVVYVDDGSRDDSFAVASGLPAEALDVQVVSLSRNFGKEAALLAGLDHARLGAVLFMDGDGQHPASLVPKLVGHWLDDGYDVVYTAKAHRANESWSRRFMVRQFYRLINYSARAPIPEDAGDFRLLSPRAADALRRHAGAQPLLQGAGKLDRLPAVARRL